MAKNDFGQVLMSADFDDFLRPGCDRAQFIEDWLESKKIEASSLLLEGSKQILVQFNKINYSSMYRSKVFVAHYDRTDDSPGANDNSAAVFQLLFLAARLSDSIDVHNVRIFFTDGEETNHLKAQGSYKLASRLRTLGLTGADFFIFDCCGRGNTLVVSTAGQDADGGADFRRDFDNLFQRVQKIAAANFPKNSIALPVPYSDNAAFLSAGIPSVAIAMLPDDEADKLRVQARCGKITQKSLVLSNPKVRARLPETWRLIHTEKDTKETLDAKAFETMGAFLDVLSKTLYAR